MTLQYPITTLQYSAMTLQYSTMTSQYTIMTLWDSTTETQEHHDPYIKDSGPEKIVLQMVDCVIMWSPWCKPQFESSEI